jgi:hypothetical protein
MGLVAPIEIAPSVRRQQFVGPRKWPRYEKCLANAPLTQDGDRPDVSRADFTWCVIAIDWGWSVEETATKLREESVKAREKGERYALETAKNAAAAVERRQSDISPTHRL